MFDDQFCKLLPIDQLDRYTFFLSVSFRLGHRLIAKSSRGDDHTKRHPLLPFIKADLALSYAETGFLFAVPTVMMALFGLPGGLLADTIGMKKTITFGLILLLAGSALRATTSGFIGLAIWTGLFGAGMGIANPGLTRMVRDRFPDLPGTATGIFTSGFIVGATAGSWLTYPYLM